MQQYDDGTSIITRRALMLGVSQAGLMSLLAGRLYYLQVIQSKEFSIQAEENRVNIALVAPRRGRIFDRFGQEIATNRPNFQVILIPEQTQNPVETIDRLERIIPVSPKRRRRVLRDILRIRGFVSLTVAENLTLEQFSTVNVHLPHLPGLETRVGEMRYYPKQGEFAHIVGYVGVPNKDDLLDNNPLLKLEGFRLGKSGIESKMDEQLRGLAGSRQVEVNSGGRVIRELSRNPSMSGDDIVLTLDAELQKYALARMGEQSGSVAVMEVNSGDVLALASNPYFDPNDFNLGISQKRWDALVEDRRKPLLNKSITGQYAPGSTFKMLVALAGLEEGVITPDEKVTCTSIYKFGKDTFHCWFEEGHGLMNMHNGIKHSCDVYFYELSRRLGIEPIARMAKKFGLGEKTNITAHGEKKGIVPSRDWKRANLDALWQQGETLITGIGQGYLLATPLQLVQMVSSLANGEKKVRPNLIYAIGDTIKTMPEFDALDVNPDHLGLVHTAMRAVTHEPKGTAFMPSLNVNGQTMAGKTGTVQVRRISAAEREEGIIKNKDLNWHLRDHALFVGFAPVKNPKYAISVVVEHGGSGSRQAAPIARDVMRKVLERDPQSRDVYLPVSGADGQRQV